MADKCVEVLFAKEGESVEEAKERLASNKKTKEEADEKGESENE